MNKDFFTVETLKLKTKLSKTSIWRKLKKQRKHLISEKLIIEGKGKQQTLYHKSLLSYLKGETQNLNHYKLNTNAEPKPEKDKKNEPLDVMLQEKNVTLQTEKFKTEIQLLKKDLENLTDKLQDKNKTLEIYEKKYDDFKLDMKEYKKLLGEKDSFIENLTNRHDTIVMTMSKQLESLNEKLLLIEDKTNKTPKTNNFYPLVLQSVIFSILIIVYIKVLFI